MVIELIRDVKTTVL